jgi:NAD(P)-dependent dehydrogenase (short-subunit alcohol dehydrogenase family)
MSKTALVTGASRGLGRAVALGLARSGANVVLVVRDHERGAAVADEVRAAHPDAEADLLVGDLSELDEVRRIAVEAASRHPDLSLLVNNAGVSKFSREVTAGGLERTFATNHLAPFLLSNLLLDLLAGNAGARIVNVSSEQHRWVGGIPWDDLQAERRFVPLEAYNLTKLYNVLFTAELARRVPQTAIRVNSLSPGFLRTDLGREATGFFRVFLGLSAPFRKPAEVGATAVLKVAEAEGSGLYFRGAKPAEPSGLARDAGAAARLWDLSAELVGEPGLRGADAGLHRSG